MVRPREFDENEALDRVVHAFWSHGYQATTVDHLIKASGLGRSSLYNAFGDKRELFQRAMERYQSCQGGDLLKPLMEQRGAQALRGFFDNLEAFVQSPQGSHGCLLVNAGVESVAVDTALKDFVREHFENIAQRLGTALSHAAEDGELAPGLPQAGLGDWLMTFVRGLLSAAASGTETQSLLISLQITRQHLGL